MMRLLASLVLSAFVLIGCGDDDGAEPALEASAPAGLAAGLPAALRTDLANRLDVDGSRVRIVEFCRVTWPDASLGVSEPGRVYTQVLIDGWLAILKAGGEDYRFHGAGDRFIAADFVSGATVLDSTRCP